MSYRGLYILVEGVDDERFFQSILKPELQEEYNFVKIITYANQNKKMVHNYLKSFKGEEADYIYVTDIDNSPCIADKKKENM